MIGTSVILPPRYLTPHEPQLIPIDNAGRRTIPPFATGALYHHPLDDTPRSVLVHPLLDEESADDTYQLARDWTLIVIGHTNLVAVSPDTEPAVLDFYRAHPDRLPRTAVLYNDDPANLPGSVIVQLDSLAQALDAPPFEVVATTMARFQPHPPEPVRVPFEPGQDTVDQRQTGNLRDVASMFDEIGLGSRILTVTVTGGGDDPDAESVGLTRASSVRDALIANGIPPGGVIWVVDSRDQQGSTIVGGSAHDVTVTIEADHFVTTNSGPYPPLLVPELIGQRGQRPIWRRFAHASWLLYLQPDPRELPDPLTAEGLAAGSGDAAGLPGAE